MTQIRTWHLECVDPAARSNKFYRAFNVDNVPVYQYGARGSLGQLSVKKYNPLAHQEITAQVDAKIFTRGYTQVGEELDVGLPDGFDPHGTDALTVLDDAFRAAWSHRWEHALTQLAAAADDGERRLLVLPTFAARRRTWPGQDTTQPWGRALADALSGCPRVDDAERDVTVALAGAELGDWVRRWYRTARDTGYPVAALPALPTDGQEVLTGLLQLWQPGTSGPLADAQHALQMARAVAS